MTYIPTSFVDRCMFLAASGGTGTFTVGSAITGYQTPSAAGAISNATYGYFAQSIDLSQWEYGRGTYSAGTLTRTVLGNSLGTTSPVSFSSAPNVGLTTLGEALTPTFNVKAYGAVGNGSTDDTAAINSAISALNTAGSGVLYFPTGTYKTTTALTTITANGTVRGDGTGGINSGNTSAVAGAATLITNNTTNTSVFTVTNTYLIFRDLAIQCTAGSPTTGSVGIIVTSSNGNQRCDFDGITVEGFNICIDVQTGADWTMHNSFCSDPVLYGLKIRNTNNADTGDWNISDSTFIAFTRAPTSAIRIESSGGGKISNIKINSSVLATAFANGIDVVGGAGTSDLQIVNSSIENFSAIGIKVNGSWPNITISNIEFFSRASPVNAINMASTTSACISNIILNTVFSSNPIAFSSVSDILVNNVVTPNSQTSSLISGAPGATNSTADLLGTVFGDGYSVVCRAAPQSSVDSFGVSSAGSTSIGINAVGGSNTTGINFTQALAQKWSIYTTASSTPDFRVSRSNEADIVQIQPTLDQDVVIIRRRLSLPAANTSRASLNIASSSATAPTSPADGDIWYDGTNIKIRVGATTKTFTIT